MHSSDVMIRSQLTDRYKVRNITIPETIALLREVNQWNMVREAWTKQFRDGPETAAAKDRRARNAGRKSGPGSRGRKAGP